MSRHPTSAQEIAKDLHSNHSAIVVKNGVEYCVSGTEDGDVYAWRLGGDEGERSISACFGQMEGDDSDDYTDAAASIAEWIKTPATQREVLAEVASERVRQDAQWGGAAHDDHHSSFEWEDFRRKFERQVFFSRNDPIAQREALLKIAALAVAQIESLDRKRSESA
jgi:hypothetical protein